ncbi:MAG: T9SS type A sorting domain-containing protein [Ignavibacteriaceae bacterium]
MKKFCSIILVLLSIITLNASTYYVDQVNGNNSNSGLTPSIAWKTISKVNSFSFKPGDNILFKTGQIWREALVIKSSGQSYQPVTFASYGTGEKPIISGADIITGFVSYSGNVWRKSVYITTSQQVFFNGIRGKRKTSAGALSSARDWYYDKSARYLYVYSSGNPASLYKSPGIEASVRNYSVYVNSNFVVVKDMQIEKTSSTAFSIPSSSGNITADNITFLQWTDEETSAKGGIVINGNNCVVKNSTFGKQTGNDIDDQKWAGFVPIVVKAKNTEITNNKLLHNSTENENGNGSYAYGIRATLYGGKIKIAGNYIYHVGSNGVFLNGYSQKGDIIEVHDNIIEYTGQAGISAFKTRSGDGIGGKGYVFKNNVSFANRLGGDIGGNGTQASGIHFNDGIRKGTELTKPYMKWYCYENVVHNSQALKVPNGPDSDGIALDYNANNVEVYRNLIYNNYGRGIYIWNANNCKVYYNIMYGNDGGITVSTRNDKLESTNNNEIYNNIFYKNYNGDNKGQNIDSEMYFGWYSKNNVFKNNIAYASVNGYAYCYGPSGASGFVLDNNLVYSDLGTGAKILYDGLKGKQNLTQWKSNHSGWDKNSIDADPMFVNAGAGDFSLKAASPAINKGVNLGLLNDFLGEAIYGSPDMGAMEYIYVDHTAPSVDSVQIINDVNVRVIFSEEINLTDLQNIKNYVSAEGIQVLSAVADPCSSKVTLLTTAHASGNFTIKVANIKDLAGNLISTSNYSGTYSFTACPADTVIRISADQGILSGSAALKSQSGSLSAKAAYFNNSTGEITYTVKIPKSAYWYGWARLYYGSSSPNNSFIIRANDRGHILGDDPAIRNKWHYDGYQHADIHLGRFQTGDILTITIRPREPGETVLLDQILLSPDPNFIPQDESSVMPVKLAAPLNNASEQVILQTLKWRKDAAAKSYSLQIGKDSSFSSLVHNSTITDTAEVISGLQYSTRYFWRVKSLDNDIESEWSDTWNFSCKTGTVVLIDAMNGKFTGDARLGSRIGMKNYRAVYFQGTSGGVTYNVQIPEAGKWYAWARMYYMSSGGKNSFYIAVNNTKHILGDDDSKFNQWHWDGYRGTKIELGTLNAGLNTVMISGREPGFTLWIDQIVLTNDPNYTPSVLGKESSEEEIENIPAMLPSDYEVSQNFPNPFNPSTNIRFSMPETEYVSLKIYDILGNEVADIVNNVLPAGYHEVKFNAADLASGIYIYQLRAGDFSRTMKMQLLK